MRASSNSPKGTAEGQHAEISLQEIVDAKQTQAQEMKVCMHAYVHRGRLGPLNSRSHASVHRTLLNLGWARLVHTIAVCVES